MPNKNYVKGRNKEYRICKECRENGSLIVQRTAGSHSEIDIFAIYPEKRIIKFIQSKPDNFPESETAEIHRRLDFLNGLWEVEFELK